MSCLITSATRTSRMVWRTIRTASAAASSHELLLVPMMSMTLYTLMTASSTAGWSRDARISPPPCCIRRAPAPLFLTEAVAPRDWAGEYVWVVSVATARTGPGRPPARQVLAEPLGRGPGQPGSRRPARHLDPLTD